MKTRQQYLNGECTHWQYYGQFVKERILKHVQNRFTIKELKDAYNENNSFNTVRLASWDGMANCLRYDKEICTELRNAGDYLTSANSVCILKEAARQLIEVN